MLIYKKINHILGHHFRKKIVLLFFLMIISVFLEMLSFYIFIPLINLINDINYVNIYLSKFNIKNIDIKSIDKFTLLKYSLVVIFIINLIKSIFFAYLSWVQSNFTTLFSANVAEKLYSGYINLNYDFHLNHNSSILIRNIQLENLQLLEMIKSFLAFCVEFSVVISILVIIFFYEPIGAFTIFIFIFISTFLYNYLTKNKIKNWGINRQKVDGLLNRTIIEGFGGIKETKIYNLEKYIINNFKKINKERSNILTRLLTFEKIPKIYLEFLGLSSLIVFVIFSYYKYHSIEKIITIVGIFSIGFLRILPSINRIISSIQQIRFSFPVINLIYNEYIEIENSSTNINSSNFKNNSYLIFDKSKNLIIKDLSYKYPFTDNYVIKDLTLKMSKNQIFGIIGDSGSGKTTLVNLISGILKPNFGKIYLDSNEECSYNLNHLIGYVPQSQFLTDDTILKNITYSENNNDLDQNLLQSVIKDSQLDNLSKILPDGLETNVGERGIKLSGGQIQRIGIARALYRNSKILIFDEATSALDIETEKSFINVIEKLKDDKIIIIITHRTEPLKCCDKIYKLKNGLIEIIK